MPEHRMLKWFEFEHLPNEGLRELSSHYRALALTTLQLTETGPEQTVALRKLLEAKDAAVRSLVHPGN